jgi:hypothetical protein
MENFKVGDEESRVATKKHHRSAHTRPGSVGLNSIASSGGCRSQYRRSQRAPAGPGLMAGFLVLGRNILAISNTVPSGEADLDVLRLRGSSRPAINCGICA